MAGNPSHPALPARMEATFSTLLNRLTDCNHQATGFLEQTPLPRWSRRCLFFCLGYVARADGRVTEADIAYAEGLIRALGLSARQRRKAIKQFQAGKTRKSLPHLTGLPIRLFSRLWPKPALSLAVCLCHAAQLKGPPGKPRRYRCEDAIDRLGLPVGVCDDILESYARKVWIRPTDIPAKPETYEDACRILGVTRRDSQATIKRAYRKKVSECHPDKLAQQRLSPRELSLAKEQLLRYQQAWELIRRRQRPL